MFFIDTVFPLKPARAARIVRRSCMQCHILHAVSMTPHAFFIFFAYHRRFANDFQFSKLFENFIVHAVSMTSHASCMPCH
jgi:hypothetical protein